MQNHYISIRNAQVSVHIDGQNVVVAPHLSRQKCESPQEQHFVRSPSAIPGDNVASKAAVFRCWSFASLQHSRSSQDEYRLVAVHTHGAFVVLSHWEIRSRVQGPDTFTRTLSEPVLTLSYIYIYILSAG